MASRPRPAAGTPEAKARRSAKPDLSRLTEGQRFNLALVVTFATAAWGERWQTPLAQALSELRGKPVGADQVASWASGRRPVPEEVGGELFDLRERVAAELRARAQRVLDWPLSPVDPDAPLSPLKDALTEIDEARQKTIDEIEAELLR